MTPTNDARALHDLLETVCTGQKAPLRAWGDVLGVDYGTIEYARRHAEVVGLFTGTLQQVTSLPDRTRERFERYTWQWWMAVVAPQHAWSNEVDMKSVLDPQALDQLGSAADLIEARMAGSLAVPAQTDLAGLQASCQEWIDLLVRDTDLASSLRLNLLQDLHHIMWLIEHADIFGIGRVAAAGETIVGNITVAGETVSGPKRGDWLERGKRLVAALVLIGGVAQGVETSAMVIEGATTFIGELTAQPDSVDPSAPGPINEA